VSAQGGQPAQGDQPGESGRQETPSEHRAERHAAEPVLKLDRVSLSFGGLQALSDLELHVDPGEVVSVIGPNGAGKTTVFNVITGMYRPSSGDVRFAGQSIAGRPPHRITRLGIARTFQSLRLFLNMSVIENVMAATYGRTRATPLESVLRLPRARREEREVRALAEEVLSFFGQRLAGYRWDQPAYSLSYANRRRLEIARALATRPRLLLLDEPAAGMNPTETREITELIGRLRDERDVAILVIEHDMHVVAGCSDRVIALDHGVKIAEGGFDQVASHPAVVEAYMGRDPEALAESE
jgi:branched-chain amino acid transport system ATP-binding protein